MAKPPSRSTTADTANRCRFWTFIYPPKSLCGRARTISNLRTSRCCGQRLARSPCFTHDPKSKDEFDCELDLALRDRRSSQQARRPGRSSVREKDVGVVRSGGRREVGVV